VAGAEAPGGQVGEAGEVVAVCFLLRCWVAVVGGVQCGRCG
jgi:hypothetical protein